MSIVNLDVAGAISNISLWTILDPPLGKVMVYISPNCSGGGMLIFFPGMRDPLNAQQKTRFLMDGWDRLIGVRM